MRLLVASDCNIRCFYCHNEGQPKGQERMKLGLVERVRQLLALNATQLSAITFSGGEPLLHPKLERFIERLAPFTTRRTVVTNGLLLTADRIAALRDAGVTKIRVGIDSLKRSKSRPTLGPAPRVSIETIAEWLMKSSIAFELNVVLTRFNVAELDELLTFSKTTQVSAKYFEHVRVRSFGIGTKQASIEPRPFLPFESFASAVSSVFPGVDPEISRDLGGANHIFNCGPFSIRYCRYLCPYRLCFMTGTRIDARGSVYTCMGSEGKYLLSAAEPLSRSVDTVLSAVREGCGCSDSAVRAA